MSTSSCLITAVFMAGNVFLTEDSQSEARKRKKEYMENQPEYPYRIKKVRVPIAQ